LPFTSQQSPDRGPVRVGRLGPKSEGLSDRTKRPRLLEGMGIAAEHRGTTLTSLIDQALHQPGLADPRFAFDDEGGRRAASDILHKLSRDSQLVLSPN
jgi:hypothetical protein